MIKIACQTITWGPELNRNNLSGVLNEIKKAGYDAFEIGFRHLDPGKIEFYKELMSEIQLKLLALHIGGDFLDPESIKRQMADIETSIKIAVELGATYIFISGKYKDNKTVDDYKIEADSYNKIGAMCIDYGVKLCYHNHSWEIKDDMIGLKTLLSYTDKKLVYYVPDVGWMTVGGANPAVVVKDMYDRIEAVHFKDFTSEHGFTELGYGIVDFRGVYNMLKDKEDLWIVSEQDTTARTPFESAAINKRYLESLIRS